jgi:hypothetical protein
MILSTHLPPSQPSPTGEGVKQIISPLGETGKGAKEIWIKLVFQHKFTISFLPCCKIDVLIIQFNKYFDRYTTHRTMQGREL